MPLLQDAPLYTQNLQFPRSNTSTEVNRHQQHVGGFGRTTVKILGRLSRVLNGSTASAHQEPRNVFLGLLLPVITLSEFLPLLVTHSYCVTLTVDVVDGKVKTQFRQLLLCRFAVLVPTAFSVIVVQ